MLVQDLGNVFRSLIWTLWCTLDYLCFFRSWSS